MSLILASGSPRRAELLTAAGFAFEIVPAHVDESRNQNETPATYAMRVARAKAARVLNGRLPGEVVIAADTVVVADGVMMGKPANGHEAESMLRRLSGGAHDVLTAVVVSNHQRSVSELVTTRVRFLPLTDREVAWYLNSGEPEGKAGAYAIQGRAARFVDSIEGSWSNVVGLPISAVYRLLKELGELD
jgi:septum formation protein